MESVNKKQEYEKNMRKLIIVCKNTISNLNRQKNVNLNRLDYFYEIGYKPGVNYNYNQVKRLEKLDGIITLLEHQISLKLEMSHMSSNYTNLKDDLKIMNEISDEFKLDELSSIDTMISHINDIFEGQQDIYDELNVLQTNTYTSDHNIDVTPKEIDKLLNERRIMKQSKNNNEEIIEDVTNTKMRG